MVDDKDTKTDEKYNLNLLRGWQRSQLELLGHFATKRLLSQTYLSGASGMRPGSHALGGKLTALTRANLIQKAGRDDNGQWMWQLNDDEVDRDKLEQFLKNIDISSGLASLKEEKSK